MIITIAIFMIVAGIVNFTVETDQGDKIVLNIVAVMLVACGGFLIGSI